MSDEITFRTESIDPWQPHGCISCPKKAQWQEKAYRGEEELQVSIGHCGKPDCAAFARKEGRRKAAELKS